MPNLARHWQGSQKAGWRARIRLFAQRSTPVLTKINSSTAGRIMLGVLSGALTLFQDKGKRKCHPTLVLSTGHCDL